MENLNGQHTHTEHCEILGRKVDSVRVAFKRAGFGPFDRHAFPTDEQYEALYSSKGALGHTRTDANSEHEQTANNGQRTTDGRERAQTSEAGHGKETDKSARTKTIPQTVVLWGVMALCAAISTHNMAYIANEITGVLWVSWCITALFTVGPFAMIWAGVKWWGVSAACILVEVFCNTTGIFRGLAGLKNTPLETYNTGSFIDSLSTLVNLPQRTCAVSIAAIFAGLVAGVFVVCLIETRK